MKVNLSSVTTPLRGLWDELVERRLWPLALALVVALVAVPVILSKPAKQAAPLPPAPTATGSASAAVAFQPAVTTEGRKSSEIRKNLRHFKRKNPFTPQGVSAGGGGGTAAGGTATPVGGSVPAASTTGGDTSTGAASSGDASSGSTTTGSTTGSSGSSSKTFYYHYTANVLFGKKDNPDAKTLSELRALPSSDNPILVFMGVKKDGKTAVFLIAANASVDGDGTCKPTDTECTFLYMKKGDKQTIEAVDTAGTITDYALELRGIEVKRTNGPAKASSSKSERARLRRESRAHLRTVSHSFQALGL